MAPPQSSDHLTKVLLEGSADLDLGTRGKVTKPTPAAARAGQPLQPRGSDEVPPARHTAASGGGRVPPGKDTEAITSNDAARIFKGTMVVHYSKKTGRKA
ncbi:hypothetical protein U1Q18_043760 [Sarracenia purpurea var. burkii]